MDPRTNPFSPGAGNPPPELVGREDLIEQVSIEMDRCKNGFSQRSFLMHGLRGVGKTVLLNKLAIDAESKKFIVVSLEVPENRSLPGVLVPKLRSALLKLDRSMDARDQVGRLIKILGSFVSSMKIKYQDVEFGLDLGSEPGIADSGDFENDLTELFVQIGQLAKDKGTAFILFIDEVQYIAEEQFAGLIMALHRCMQMGLPVMIVGTGLPQLIGLAGRAKSYAERLFLYPEIGPLENDAAKKALTIPAETRGVIYAERALDEILSQTRGYAYFVQEWGKHSWVCAEASPITEGDAKRATEVAISDLDASFFRVRFDRLTPSEKRYLRAMAELGEEPYRSGDIASKLHKTVSTAAPTRASLIKKGMIYSKSHGGNSFTVPLFAAYMKRVMPILDL